MRRARVARLIAVAYGVLALFSARTTLATPQFARETKLPCASCHTHAPRLNEFGLRYGMEGFRLKGRKLHPTYPFWMMINGQTRAVPSGAKEWDAIFSRLEIQSQGGTNDRKTQYALEWRAYSRDILDNGSIRDTSGSFVDAYLVHTPTPGLTLQVGQFRSFGQFDVSHRLQLGDPLVFAGPGGDTDFLAPGGRSPSARVRLSRPDWRDSWNTWNLQATLALMGEFSLPTTADARRSGPTPVSTRTRGTMLELFRQFGLSSVGLHYFGGPGGRTTYGLAGRWSREPFVLEGGVAEAKVRGRTERWYSLGLDWIPEFKRAYGLRLDYRDAPGSHPLFVPYASFFIGEQEQVLKIVAEARLGQGRRPTLALEASFRF